MTFLFQILILALQKKDLIFIKVIVKSVTTIISFLKFHLRAISFFLSISLCLIKLKINQMVYRYTSPRPYLELHQYILSILEYSSLYLLILISYFVILDNL